MVEAAASGLPVVASDIPAHREIAEGLAQFHDPLDGPGWLASVERLMEADSPLRADLAARLDGYRPPDWSGTLRGGGADPGRPVTPRELRRRPLTNMEKRQRHG